MLPVIIEYLNSPHSLSEDQGGPRALPKPSLDETSEQLTRAVVESREKRFVL
jgi:hypothetical protein